MDTCGIYWLSIQGSIQNQLNTLVGPSALICYAKIYCIFFYLVINHSMICTIAIGVVNWIYRKVVIFCIQERLNSRTNALGALFLYGWIWRNRNLQETNASNYFIAFAGTLRPDLIESASHLASARADAIKTHHNDTHLVRLLRERGRIIEPLRDFHKDEVRQLGAKLGLPESMLMR